MSKAIIEKLLSARKYAVEFEEIGVKDICDIDGDILVNYELFFKLAKDKEISVIDDHLSIDTEDENIMVITNVKCDVLTFLKNKNIKFKMV